MKLLIKNFIEKYLKKRFGSGFLYLEPDPASGSNLIRAFSNTDWDQTKPLETGPATWGCGGL